MNDLEILWKRVLGDIKIEVSQGSFVTIIKPTTLLSLENNIATIGVLSFVHINMIKKFEPIIKAAFEKHTGKETQLTFIPKPAVPKQQIEQPGSLFVEERIKKTIGHLPRVRPDYTFGNCWFWNKC